MRKLGRSTNYLPGSGYAFLLSGLPSNLSVLECLVGKRLAQSISISLVCAVAVPALFGIARAVDHYNRSK